MSKLSKFKNLLAVPLVGAVLISCSNSYVAQQSEWDDMYFTPKDRKSLEASSEVFVDNFKEDHEPLTQEAAENYRDVNYSSKTVNPEYIAKYQVADDGGIPQVQTAEYYEEGYGQESYSDQSYSYNTRYGSNYSYWPTYYNPSPAWGFYDPWYYGYPVYARPGLSVSVSFGYGGYSRWDPWYSGYYGYGWGDPWYYGRYRRFRTFGGYYSYSYWDPYGFGYSSFCPYNTVVYNNYYVDRSRYIESRDVVRGPRVARGGSQGTNVNRNGYRSGSSDRIAASDYGSTARTSTGDRNNYYRRTRTANSSSTSANTRSYQPRSRSSNVDAGNRSSANRNYSTRPNSSSNYSRSSGSSYNTRTNPNTNRSQGTYRSNTDSQRSSGSYRSGAPGSSGSRSSGSYRSSGSSTRSSGSTRSFGTSPGSSSRSSGTMRSSSSSSSRSSGSRSSSSSSNSRSSSSKSSSGSKRGN